MKSTIYLSLTILLFLLILSCKSQQKHIKIVELPAYQPENEIGTIKSILNTPLYNSFEKLIVNDKEYPIKDLQKIKDTLNIDRYSIKVETDSVFNRKTLILKAHKN